MVPEAMRGALGNCRVQRFRHQREARADLPDGADDDKQAALAATMLKVATEIFAADKTGGGDEAEPSLIFFTARSSESVVGRVREMTKLKPPPTPVLLLLDIADNGGFFVREESEPGETRRSLDQGLRGRVQGWHA